MSKGTTGNGIARGGRDSDREARLKAALRANLRRRKAQARKRGRTDAARADDARPGGAAADRTAE